jgi:hypothetical protein
MPSSESRVWESWLPRSVTPDAELRVNSDLTGNALPLLLALRARPAFDFVCLKSQSGSPTCGAACGTASPDTLRPVSTKTTCTSRAPTPSREPLPLPANRTWPICEVGVRGVLSPTPASGVPLVLRALSAYPFSSWTTRISAGEAPRVPKQGRLLLKTGSHG